MTAEMATLPLGQATSRVEVPKQALKFSEDPRSGLLTHTHTHTQTNTHTHTHKEKEKGRS